jgi:hypothetical protein
MPVVGRHKKAKVADVYKAYMERPDRPVPGPHEKFSDYRKRLPDEDPFWEMVVKMGYGEPTRMEYLRRLGEIAELLYSLRDELDAAWPRH